MEPAIRLRGERVAPRPEETDFQRLLRRYEVREEAEGRVRMLGGLYLALAALGIACAAVVFVAIAPWGLLSGDPTATAVLAGVGGALAAILTILSAPGLVGAFGLLTRRSWARAYAIVLGAALLLWFPVGTLLGAYTLYVMLHPDTSAYFASRHG